jgi:hypothetical protein
MGGVCRAVPVTPTGSFGADTDLAAEMAAVARLDTGVDATPRLHGWPRVVQDLLERAGVMIYADRTPRHRERPSRAWTASAGGGASAAPSRAPELRGRGGFLAVVVATGGVGQLD